MASGNHVEVKTIGTSYKDIADRLRCSEDEVQAELLSERCQPFIIELFIIRTVGSERASWELAWMERYEDAPGLTKELDDKEEQHRAIRAINEVKCIAEEQLRNTESLINRMRVSSKSPFFTTLEQDAKFFARSIEQLVSINTASGRISTAYQMTPCMRNTEFVHKYYPAHIKDIKPNDDRPLKEILAIQGYPYQYQAVKHSTNAQSLSPRADDSTGTTSLAPPTTVTAVSEVQPPATSTIPAFSSGLSVEKIRTLTSMIAPKFCQVMFVEAGRLDLSAIGGLEGLLEPCYKAVLARRTHLKPVEDFQKLIDGQDQQVTKQSIIPWAVLASAIVVMQSGHDGYKSLIPYAERTIKEMDRDFAPGAENLAESVCELAFLLLHLYTVS